MPSIPMTLFSALQASLAASLLIGAGSASPVQAQANDMFPTKASAQQRARQLKCTGAFPMGKAWMPCKDLPTYQQAFSRNP